MSNEQKTINTLVADYERLYGNVRIANGLFQPLAEELLEHVPPHLKLPINAYMDLLSRISEDMENSYAVSEMGVF